MLLSIHGLWKFELFWAYPNESNNKKWSKRFLKGLLVNQNTNCYTQESIKKKKTQARWCGFQDIQEENVSSPSPSLWKSRHSKVNLDNGELSSLSVRLQLWEEQHRNCEKWAFNLSMLSNRLDACKCNGKCEFITLFIISNCCCLPVKTSWC